MVVTNQEMLDWVEQSKIWVTAHIMDRSDAWYSTFVDDVYPNVERLWRQIAPGVRVNIHRILSIPPGAKPLFHRHTRPEGFEILSGAYRSNIGHGDPNASPPPVAYEQIFRKGDRYTMPEPGIWHDVQPIETPCLTIMVSLKPFKNVSERTVQKQLFTLSDIRK